MKRIAWIWILLATGFTTACLWSLEEPTPTAVPTSPVVPTPTPAEPPWAVVICLDISGSYSPPLREAAQAYLTQQLERLLRPGFPGAKVFFRLIEANSYRQEALVDRFDLPPVPFPLPTPAPLPTPDNPMQRRDWSLAATATRQAFATLEGLYHQSLSALLRQAEVHLGRIRDFGRGGTATPTPAARSDIWGCLSAAAEHLAPFQGPRWLLIASDLEVFGEQQRLQKMHLAGVKVRVVFFQCRTARACEERREFWEGVLTGAGADVRFFRPGDEPPDLWK